MHYDQFGTGPELVWVAGGGMLGSQWHLWQVPYFASSWRQTTFDNRGIGGTSCSQPEPWTIADMAGDAAALIETVCNPPVVAVGLSMGSLIAIELALDRPDLLLCAVAMGTLAQGNKGWVGDYMQAEVELRR
jgi:pimeloyl-ACP methyl ester carboxylesterase